MGKKIFSNHATHTASTNGFNSIHIAIDDPGMLFDQLNLIRG